MTNVSMKNTEIPPQLGLQFFQPKGKINNLILCEKTTLAPSQALRAWKIQQLLD